MELLYVSSLVSDSLFDVLLKRNKTKGYTGQKYHGLFTKGLCKNVGLKHVTILSQPPINNFFIKFNDFDSNGRFRYVPIIPIPIIKQLIYFIYSFCYTLYWCVKNIRRKKVIIVSFMRVYQFPSVWLGACLFKVKKISVVCDVPWMTTVQVTTSKLSFKQKFAIWLGRKLNNCFDGYVFLTESMNKVINQKKKPYIVVEGFCDQRMAEMPNLLENKTDKKVILYAGGLKLKYGIGALIEAVKSIELPNIELWLYGTGDMDKQLEQEEDIRIVYWGAKNNQEVVDAEIKSTILINPRPTTDEYTRYSFPSKTMEYMASGTYTLTTRLAGIPNEYFQYCGTIENYDTKGIADAIKLALCQSPEELHNKGMKAKEFVLEHKNNIIQTQRVIDFLQII